MSFRQHPGGALPFRRALVTGASGRTGSRFARALARRGVPLIVTDIDKAPLLGLARELGAEAVVCDLLSEHGIAALVSRALRAGDSDLLINCGGAGYVRALGMMRLAREFAQRPASEAATVVNIAATSRLSPGGATFAYAGSAVAFQRLSRGLATRLAGRLRVITIDPPELDSQVEDFVDQLVRGESHAQADLPPARRSGNAG